MTQLPVNGVKKGDGVEGGKLVLVRKKFGIVGGKEGDKTVQRGAGSIVAFGVFHSLAGFAFFVDEFLARSKQVAVKGDVGAEFFESRIVFVAVEAKVAKVVAQD